MYEFRRVALETGTSSLTTPCSVALAAAVPVKPELEKEVEVVFTAKQTSDVHRAAGLSAEGKATGANAAAMRVAMD